MTAPIIVEYRKGTELMKRTTYEFYTKDEVIRMAKHLGMEMKADELWIFYRSSNMGIGYFERKGSRWYKL